MPLILNMVLIVAGSIALIHAVKLFIESSSKIAHKMGVSGYTISFLLVAIATSLPEVVVGITSAVENNPILSFGNALGSNVALITLVVAIPILLNAGPGISTRTLLHSKNTFYALFFSLLPIALLVDGSLSRVDGGILVALYIIYFGIVWRKSRGIERIVEELTSVNMWKQGTIFVASLLLLLASSEVIVQSALGLSSGLKLSITFIGLSITAIGTSLPEIAFTISAAKGRFHQQIFGDVVGSIVANSTVVLGITALITPITIKNGVTGYTAVASFMLILIIFLIFIKTREKLDKLEAFLLLTLYVLFLVLEYYMQINGLPHL